MLVCFEPKAVAVPKVGRPLPASIEVIRWGIPLVCSPPAMEPRFRDGLSPLYSRAQLCRGCDVWLLDVPLLVP
ncbi:MAG: hypothetical protein SGPRY_015002 [Prymnesium sp.]